MENRIIEDEMLAEHIRSKIIEDLGLSEHEFLSYLAFEFNNIVYGEMSVNAPRDPRIGVKRCRACKGRGYVKS